MNARKPWDDEWVQTKIGHTLGVTRKAGADDPILRRHIAMVYVPTTGDEEGVSTWAEADSVGLMNATFMAAGPRVARALLKVLSLHSVVMTRKEAEVVTEAQNALRDAGVIP